MTDKEKARAYDEALERARKLREQVLNNELLGFPDQFTEIFPELRESEDERIRKEIVSVIQKHYPNTPESYRWISWLEKQKVNTEGNFGRGYDCGYESCLHSHGAEWSEKQKETHYTKRNELFDKCVENCDPEVMKEVSNNIDKMLEPKIAFGDWGDKEKQEALEEYNKSVAFRYYDARPLCWEPGGTCTNPQMDCVNCPRKTTGGFNTSSGTSTLKAEG